MELKVVESGKEKLRIEVVGEDHTFCNVLRKNLWEDKSVNIAGYSIKHSLVDNPIIVIESSNPKKSLSESAKRLKKENEDFLKKFKAL